jgi:MYXO-CTERM domain-containing protein
LPTTDGDGDVIAPEEVWSYEDANGAGGKDGSGGFILEDTEGSGQLNSNDCPEGEEMRYGKCVPIATDDNSGGEGDKAGGCSTGMEPMLPSIWLLLGLLALIRLRRSNSCGRGARVTD